MLGIAGYNAPPYIQLAKAIETATYGTDDEQMVVSGNISTLHATKLTINGKLVSVGKDGSFSYTLALAEGDTIVRIVSASDKGTDSKEFKVHRVTTAELLQRRLDADRKEAEKKKYVEQRAAKEKQQYEVRALKAKQDAVNAMPNCDGKQITSSCKAEGKIYKTFIYHPAISEKSHTVTDTTYNEVITGYCTLCNDGSYSPSCATGKGACSWHGGVAQWNAQITRKVPVYTDRVIVDAPAAAEYYEKVLDPSYN